MSIYFFSLKFKIQMSFCSMKSLKYTTYYSIRKVLLRKKGKKIDLTLLSELWKNHTKLKNGPKNWVKQSIWETSSGAIRFVFQSEKEVLHFDKMHRYILQTEKHHEKSENDVHTALSWHLLYYTCLIFRMWFLKIKNIRL